MKKGNSLIRSKRAVSAVIATVILVAVAITVSVAVAYWMGSIAGGYTQFEKVEIQSAYPSKIPSGWNMTLALKNSGSKSATLTSCYVNEKPIETYVFSNSTDNLNLITWTYKTDAPGHPGAIPASGLTIESGKSATLYVYIQAYMGLRPPGTSPTTPTGITFTSGTTINIKIHSAGGMDYPKLLELE